MIFHQSWAVIGNHRNLLISKTPSCYAENPTLAMGMGRRMPCSSSARQIAFKGMRLLRGEIEGSVWEAAVSWDKGLPHWTVECWDLHET